MWIGVVVGIPEPYSSELTKARTDAGDPLGSLVPPHVTLLPPVELADGALPDVINHISDIARANEVFSMELSGTESFRPVSPVVFVALSQGWDECVTLQKQVNSGVLETELHFPYHPHVTIAQSVEEPQLDQAQENLKDFEAAFTVPTIDLYTWDEGGGWTLVEAFTLKQPHV